MLESAKCEATPGVQKVAHRLAQIQFVRGFRPSTAGFRFANSFARQPLFRIPLPGGSLPIGDAARGLCGGMIFAVRDFFETGLLPPREQAPPPLGSPLFGYLVRRLIDSWNLPGGPLKYYAWMSLPNDDGARCRRLMAMTCRQEWPRIKAEIDSGKPSPLGLIKACSKNPWKVGLNHQVLAYGYELNPANQELILHVYDPNHAGRDDVTITLGASEASSEICHSAGAPLRGFFRTRYTFRHPPDLRP